MKKQTKIQIAENIVDIMKIIISLVILICYYGSIICLVVTLFSLSTEPINLLGIPSLITIIYVSSKFKKIANYLIDEVVEKSIKELKEGTNKLNNLKNKIKGNKK